MAIKYYTGVGARNIPDYLGKYIRQIGSLLVPDWVLRSGGAAGSDLAFELGCRDLCGAAEIYRPKDATEESFLLLGNVIEELNKEQNTNISLESMNKYTKRLLARNMHQVLGKDLNTPSEVVICYTEEGKMVGGTRYAMQLAKMRGIPICNLGYYDKEWMECTCNDKEQVEAWIEIEKLNLTIDWAAMREYCPPPQELWDEDEERPW